MIAQEKRKKTTYVYVLHTHRGYPIAAYQTRREAAKHERLIHRPWAHADEEWVITRLRVRAVSVFP